MTDSYLNFFIFECWASLPMYGRIYSSTPFSQHLVVFLVSWLRVSYRKPTCLALNPQRLAKCTKIALHISFYQSTAQPFSVKNSSQACFNAMLGRRSSKCKGSLVSGSVCDRFRCSSTVDLSYVFPVLVTTGSCMTVKDMLSIR